MSIRAHGSFLRIDFLGKRERRTINHALEGHATSQTFRCAVVLTQPYLPAQRSPKMQARRLRYHGEGEDP